MRAAARLILPLLAVLGGCDPCAGITACAAPRIHYQGRVVRAEQHVPEFQRPAPAVGVVVRVERVAGAQMRPDLLTLQTDSAGLFAVRAAAEGPVRVRLRVYESDSARAAVDTSGVWLYPRHARDPLWLGSWMLAPAASLRAGWATARRE